MQTTDLFIQMALTGWRSQNKRVDDLIAKLSAEQLQKDTAPGRNSGIYLFGHLIAVNDGILKLFGVSDKLYPELEAVFLSSPDKSGKEIPSLDNLKKYWSEINAKLENYFSGMTTADWFSRHTAVSEEDFAKEPHRNKMNILLGRTTHQAYHLGQMTYLS